MTGMGSGGWGRRDAARSVDAFREMRQAEQARETRQGDQAREARQGDQARSSDRSADRSADRSRLPPRHCWVLNPPSAPGRWPGLVVEWRTAGGHWEGRVVVVLGRGRDAAVLDVWMREEQLTPV
jgi:hypothetical protein